MNQINKIIKLILFLVIILLIPSITKGSDPKILFTLEDKVGDTILFQTLSKQDIFFNNVKYTRLNRKMLGKFKIISENQMGEKLFKGQFRFYVNSIKSENDKSPNNNQYTLIKKSKSLFYRNQRGIMQVDSKYFYPNIRNVIQFPKKEIGINDTWAGKVYIIQNLKNYGITKPQSVECMARYTYLKNTMIDNKKYAIISVFYIINQNNKTPIGKKYKSYWLSGNGSFISRWMGIYSGYYFYSFNDKSIDHFRGQYNYIFFHENGIIQEIRGYDDGIIKRTRTQS